MNATDTTNGYVLDKRRSMRSRCRPEALPGSRFFPRRERRTSGGTGANSGLGNAPIWANGQRDTSNSFLLNGVDASNLFNGKSTSQVGSARVVNSTGVGQARRRRRHSVSASVYLAIGNAIPTPAPETIQEVRVNASMYDAQQGSTSGAHIDLSTTSGTNDFHGQAYVHRGTNWINAAPFFFKQDDAIPADKKNPELHRYIVGRHFRRPHHQEQAFRFRRPTSTCMSPIRKLATHSSTCPVGLSDCPARDAAALPELTTRNFGRTARRTPISAGRSTRRPSALQLALASRRAWYKMADRPTDYWLVPTTLFRHPRQGKL